MYIDIIKGILLSFVLILIIHNLYLFFQKTLTIPKTKDLVNKPSAKYAEILKTLTNMDVEHAGTTSISQLNSMNPAISQNLLPENANTQLNNNISQTNNANNTETNSMKTELRNFLTSLNTNTEKTGAPANKTLGYANEVNSFSSY